MGGAVVAPAEWYNNLMLFRKDFGGVLSPRSRLGHPGLRPAHAGHSHVQYAEDGAARGGVPLANIPKWPASGTPARSAFRRRRWLIGRCSAQMESLLPAACSISFLREAIPSRARLRSWWITLPSTLIPSPWPSASGQVKTLIEHPFSMTHSALPDEQKRAFGMHPEGIRISLGLEDWHDIIRDLEIALEKV